MSGDNLFLPPWYLRGGQIQTILASSRIRAWGQNPAINTARQKIIETVWDNALSVPEPAELTVEHLLGGYPSKAYYDENFDGQSGAGEGIPGFFIRAISPESGDASVPRCLHQFFKTALINHTYGYESIIHTAIDIPGHDIL